MLNRPPFIRLAEEESDRRSSAPLSMMPGENNTSAERGHGNYASAAKSPANGEATSGPPQNFPTVITAGSRFRGHKEVDLNKWDEEASQHLLTMRRTPGDLCDCLRPCRKTCSLRYPPNSHKMSENTENGFALPCGVVWFVRDCAGCVCMSFTWFLIAYAEFVVACIILPQMPSVVARCIFGVTYHIFAFLAVYSHLKAVFTDPVSPLFALVLFDSFFCLAFFIALSEYDPIYRRVSVMISYPQLVLTNTKRWEFSAKWCLLNFIAAECFFKTLCRIFN